MLIACLLLPSAFLPFLSVSPPAAHETYSAPCLKSAFWHCSRRLRAKLFLKASQYAAGTLLCYFRRRPKEREFTQELAMPLRSSFMFCIPCHESQAQKSFFFGLSAARELNDPSSVHWLGSQTPAGDRQQRISFRARDHLATLSNSHYFHFVSVGKT